MTADVRPLLALTDVVELKMTRAEAATLLIGLGLADFPAEKTTARAEGLCKMLQQVAPIGVVNRLLAEDWK